MELDLKKLIYDMRIDLVKMHQSSPHIASSLSALEIIAALYFKILNIKSPDDPDRDRFILSKGHAISALYRVLERKGFMDSVKEKLDSYPQNGGKLFSHPVKNKKIGIEVSSGSLGHGLAIGSGMAFAAKKDGKYYKTYVLMGDGECEEGSVWEAAILASRLQLNNLVVLIDANGLQDSEYVDNIVSTKSFEDKWNAFGWNVCECENVLEDLGQVIKSAISDKPLVVIVHTIKGKGIKEIENKLEAHHFVVPEEKAAFFIEELKHNYEKSIK